MAVAALAGSAFAQGLPVAGLAEPGPELALTRLVGPLRTPHNDGFHAWSFAPVMESGWTATGGHGHVATYGSLTRTDVKELGGGNRFRATFGEGGLEAAIGLAESWGAPVELRVGLSAGEFHAHRQDVAATADGLALLAPERANTFALRRGMLGLKTGIWRNRRLDLDVAGIGWVKAPLGDTDDRLDTGRVEASGVLAVSHALRFAGQEAPTLFVHLNLGAVWVKEQDIFAGRIHPTSGAVYGLSVVWRAHEGLACVAQLEGRQNVWRDLDAFSDDPLVASLGLRFRVGGVAFEAGAGTGLTRDVSADWTVHVAVQYGA